MTEKNTLSFKDKVMTVGALGAMVFHAGTFYAVKDKVEKHEKEIESRETRKQQATNRNRNFKCESGKT